MRRIIDSIQSDVPLLGKVEHIMYPCLLHSLTADGLDSIEEGVDCISMFLYYGYKDKPISAEMWKLFPQLLYVCAGNDGDMEGGFGFEYVNQIVIALKNYFARDQNGILCVGENQTKTNLQLTYHFINRCLQVNRNGSDGLDGVAVMGLIIAILENMQGKIDGDLPHIVGILSEELNYLNDKKGKKNYKSMILQAFSMCFAYNAMLTFQVLEQSGQTLNVF